MSVDTPNDDSLPRRPTQRPKHPGLLATDEEHAAYAHAIAAWIKACNIQQEATFGGLKDYDTMPFSRYFSAVMRKRALQGDTREAQYRMDSLAEMFEKGARQLADEDAMFLAIALRRAAADSKAAAAISQAKSFAGGKPGRPEEARKSINTAISLAIELKKGAGMEEAIFNLQLKNKPYVPKDRRGIQRAWEKWGSEAMELVEEMARNPEVLQTMARNAGMPDPFA